MHSGWRCCANGPRGLAQTSFLAFERSSVTNDFRRLGIMDCQQCEGHTGNPLGCVRSLPTGRSAPSRCLLRVGARCPLCNRPRLACAASWLRTRCLLRVTVRLQPRRAYVHTSGFHLESWGSRHDCVARWWQGPVGFPTPRTARRWRYKRRLLIASFSRPLVRPRHRN